jgi:hypothetical protein
MKKIRTYIIAAMMLLGGVMGFVGIIQKDYASAKGHDVWLVVSILGFLAFVGGFYWLVKIQPNRK